MRSEEMPLEEYEIREETSPFIWLEAMRPKTWIASIAPIFLGTALAKHLGFFNLWIFLATLGTGLWIQIGTNLANDYFDWKKGSDTPQRVGPRRVMQASLVREEAMLKAIVFSFLLAALFCSYLCVKGGMVVLVLLVVAILLGIGYTAGPMALAYTGWGDFFVLTGFGVVAMGMTTYLQTGIFYKEAFLFGLAPGALATAILTVNNLRDYEVDRSANKKTLIVRFGREFGKAEYVTMHLLAQAVPLTLVFAFGFSWKLSLLSFLLLPSYTLIKEVYRTKSAGSFAPLLPKTALYLLCYTLAGCYALLI